MSKAKMYGMKTGYVPNAKADMRHRKKVYQRGREKAFRCQYQYQTVKFLYGSLSDDYSRYFNFVHSRNYA